MIRTIINDKSTRLFILLGGFFIANAIIAEVIGVKLFRWKRPWVFYPLILPFWAIVFLLT
ncbi:hypothetical protein KRR40_22230 [Niabella defluvii]|nr:hypothetical protein KRR40_22230 [Niabella sp. I65]